MRVFVTGGTGFIGQPMVKYLIEAGHQVVALARSDDGVKKLTALGATPLRGTILDLDVLIRGAAESDGVIHLAFNMDPDEPFENFAQSCKEDQAAIKALGAALAGSNRPLLMTSGTLLLPLGTLGTEDDAGVTEGWPALRAASEQVTLDLVPQGVRAIVVRLSPTNHGTGDKGFLPEIIKAARAKGVSAYIDSGANRWPAVHRFDTARLFVLALEKGKAGSRYHSVADEGVVQKDIAAVIGKKLGLSVVSVPQDKATEHFGWVGGPMMADNPVSSAKTRSELGWQPAELSLLQDLEQGTYFDA